MSIFNAATYRENEDKKSMTEKTSQLRIKLVKFSKEKPYEIMQIQL